LNFLILIVLILDFFLHLFEEKEIYEKGLT
jgi:hypothetical protein